MMNTHKHILVFISSSITLFGLFWICTFGDWHTVNAFGEDSSIYLVDFDETAYDLYLKGYYPSDYTYADFRRDSIEGMTSHYVATDSNNFTAIVDTIENDVLLNGWSVIDNFFEDAWLNLKTGVITVLKGFTDDFKHELDGRFKATPSGGSVSIGSGVWYNGNLVIYTSYGQANYLSSTSWGAPSLDDVYWTMTDGGLVACARYSATRVNFYYLLSNGNQSYSYIDIGTSYTGSLYTGVYLGSSGWNSYYIQGLSSQYPDKASACADFFGEEISSSAVPEWNGDGYYSDTPTDYNINLPALPSIDWSTISNNNKTKYGVYFPDVDLTIDFQLPDSYYPQSVTYDTPYWLYNSDSTSVDWANISFEDVTLPEVQLNDGDGSFFQALFGTLPLAFVPILLGVILCYLIFLML